MAAVSYKEAMTRSLTNKQLAGTPKRCVALDVEALGRLGTRSQKKFQIGHFVVDN